MKKASEIKLQARIALQGKTGKFAAAYLVYFGFSVIIALLGFLPLIGSTLSSIISFLITGPFTLGFAIIALRIARGKEFGVENLFDGFKQYLDALFASIIIAVFTFLWALLLFIPGIIKSLSYSMTYYILADNKSMTANEARKFSMDMMSGNKWRLFCLIMSFIGWIILGIFTLCILYLWLIPYMETSMAVFYQDVREQYEARNGVTTAKTEENTDKDKTEKETSADEETKDDTLKMTAAEEVSASDVSEESTQSGNETQNSTDEPSQE